MIRTTIYLPNELHFRLRAASHTKNTSMSELAKSLLDSGLKPLENEKTQAMYDALNRLKGACKVSVSDLSTTIDDTLYGEIALSQTYDER